MRCDKIAIRWTEIGVIMRSSFEGYYAYVCA